MKYRVVCDKCDGEGALMIDARDLEEVIANCRKPGATQNEIDAAAWLERLTNNKPSETDRQS